MVNLILNPNSIPKSTLILTHSNLTLPLMLTNPNLTQTYFVTTVIMVICHKYTRFVNLSQSNTVTNITDVTGYN